MGITIDPDQCVYCGACASVCPTDCITLKETRIRSDNAKCINCTACERICPVAAIQVKKELVQITPR